MKRSHLLTFAGVGSTAIAIGTVACRVGYWWSQRPATDFAVLSGEEATITAAIADALFPGDSAVPALPNGVDAGVVEKFDRYLADLDPTATYALRVVLHAIDDLAVFSDLGLARFHRRSRHERAAILADWEASGLMARRAGFQALKFGLANQYCRHPDVLTVVGMEGSCRGTR